jgi:hypothetical protein
MMSRPIPRPARGKTRRAGRGPHTLTGPHPHPRRSPAIDLGARQRGKMRVGEFGEIENNVVPYLRNWLSAATPLQPGKVEEHNVGTLLHSFQDNFTAVWGNVEVPNIEIARNVGQLPLSAGLRVH